MSERDPNKAIDFIKTSAKITEKKASKEDEAKDKED